MRSRLRIAAVSSVGAAAVLMSTLPALAAPTPAAGGPATTVASAAAKASATVTISGVRRVADGRLRLTVKSTSTQVQVRYLVGTRALSQVVRTDRGGIAVLVLHRHSTGVAVRALATPRLNASPWLPVRLPAPHPGADVVKVVSDALAPNAECATYLHRYITFNFPDVTVAETSALTFKEAVLPKAVSFKPALRTQILGVNDTSTLPPMISGDLKPMFVRRDGAIFWIPNNSYWGTVETQKIRGVYMENADPNLAKLSDHPQILYGYDANFGFDQPYDAGDNAVSHFNTQLTGPIPFVMALNFQFYVKEGPQRYAQIQCSTSRTFKVTVTPKNSSPMVETAQNVPRQTKYDGWLGSMGGGILAARIHEFRKGDWKIADPDDNANRYVTSLSWPAFAQWAWRDPVALRLDTIPAGVTATRIVPSEDPFTFTPKESTPMRAGVSYPLVDGVFYRIVAKESVTSLPFNLAHPNGEWVTAPTRLATPGDRPQPPGLPILNFVN